MSDTYILANSFADWPEASRHRLRTFLDAADSSSPFQDPLFFGGHSAKSICWLNGRSSGLFCPRFRKLALSRFLPGLRALVVHKGPVADDPDALMSGLRALKEVGSRKALVRDSTSIRKSMTIRRAT